VAETRRIARPHVCEGENCNGCHKCYIRTGETVCSLTCEHAERCQDCHTRLNDYGLCPTCDQEAIRA
jgi:hypothetical protein